MVKRFFSHSEMFYCSWISCLGWKKNLIESLILLKWRHEFKQLNTAAVCKDFQQNQFWNIQTNSSVDPFTFIDALKSFIACIFDDDNKSINIQTSLSSKRKFNHNVVTNKIINFHEYFKMFSPPKNN